MRAQVMGAAALLAAGLLAGCGEKAGSAGKAGSDSAAAAASTPADVAMTPKGAPKRADGYWEMASFGESGTQMGKQFYCVGEGSEDKVSLLDFLASTGACDKQAITRTAGGWAFETRCKMMGDTTVQTGTISGNFRDAFLIDQTVSQTGSSGNRSLKGQVRGKRVGACPAKNKPGDLVDGDGSSIGNILPH
jgi:hypothetical protein